MKPPAPLPMQAKNKGLLIFLHCCFFACSAIVSPILAIIALTMLFAFIGAATSSITNYTGGINAILLFIVFTLTPIFSILHFKGILSARKCQSTLGIWAWSIIYMTLVWIVFQLGGEASASHESTSDGRSILPLYFLVVMPSLATLMGIFLYAREAFTVNQKAD